MSVQHEAEILRSMLGLHVECCFKAPRGKKEESRQECIRDCMAAALALALESYELGVSAGLEQIAPTGTATRAITRWEQDPIAMGRAEVECLAQGKPPVDIWAAERGET